MPDAPIEITASAIGKESLIPASQLQLKVKFVSDMIKLWQGWIEVRKC
jgi:hypothetical protein